MQLRNSQWSAEFYKAITPFPGVQLCPKESGIQKKKRKELDDCQIKQHLLPIFNYIQVKQINEDIVETLTFIY